MSKLTRVLTAVTGVFSMTIVVSMLIMFVLFTVAFVIVGWTNTVLLAMVQSINDLLIETLGSLFKSVKVASGKPENG